ncbi:C39 family peptidase [Cytobacillus sp. FSL K6-0265]|uniref:C39 family peptidase n=1 Tax=Cytobacillus sp. FSL K6-0265 TaxID=2921448 RepID=UPI0030F9E170
MNYSLNIPRFSQKFEERDWPSQKLVEGNGAEYWGDRSCGLACLRMVLSYYKLPIPSQYELLLNGLSKNAYCSKGWIHSGLAKMGLEFGLKGSAISIKNGDELERFLIETGPLIASVSHELPQDGRKGGHLIVVSGRQKGNDTNIIFRDPSRWGITNSIVSEDRFFSSFTQRGI